MITKWLRRKLGITGLEGQLKTLEKENKELRSCLADHEKFVTRKVAQLTEYTRVDADIGVRGNNTIVLTGVYRNQGFVRFYDVGDGEFKALVEQMKSMQDHALIRNIDKPHQWFGVFDL